MPLVPTPKNCDPSVKKAIQILTQKLGLKSNPIHNGLTLTGLTASRLTATNSAKTLESTDLNSWVTGTANEIGITDDGDGTITIGIVDPLIVGKGGTGAASLTNHGILLGSGTSAVTPLGVATNGQIPIGSVGADPVLAEITGTANQIISTPGAGSITLRLPQNIHTGATNFTVAGATIGSVVIPGVYTAQEEPTGFVDRVATLSWNDGDFTLTITGSHDIYIHGVKTTKNTDSIQIADTTGLHWIYYDASGTLVENTVHPGWDLPIMATVYWNTTGNVGSYNKGLVGEERHGIVMNWATHEYLHETVGCRWEDGLTGTFDNTTLSITAGTWHDEDIHFIEASSLTTCNVLYKNGDANWEWDAGVSIYYKLNGTALRYNNGNNLADCTPNRYMAMWVFITSDISTPIVALMGQRQDTTLANARANNTYESLSFGTLPFKEMKLLYRVILRSTGSPPTYVETQDYRVVSNLPAGTYIATTHGVLTGLTNDDHTQYALLAGRTGGQTFSGSDTTAEDLTLKDNSVDNNTITVTQAISAYTHSGLTSGNPHSVTPAELSLVIGTDVQAHGAVLDDLNTLGAPASDGQFIVATGAGTFAYESGATARTSIGLGTGDSPTFTNLTLSGHAALGGAAIDADFGLYYGTEVLTDTDNTAKVGIFSETQVKKTAADMLTAAYALVGTLFLDSGNTQDWKEGQAGLRGFQGTVVTEAGSSGIVTGAACGFLTATIANAATVTNLYGLYVNTPTVAGGKVTNEYGIYIANQNTGATLNYALYTNLGIIHFGDSVDAFGIGIASPEESSELHVRRSACGAASYDVNAVLFLECNDHCTAIIVTPNNKQGIWGFADEDDTFVAGLTYDHNADALWLYANNAIRMTIASTGVTTFSHSIVAANYTAANLLTACATNAGALNFSAASKTLTVENNAIVSQDYTSDASPQFTGIELGHASDTTITRVSAGAIAVEGTTVMMVGDAPTAHTIASHSDTTGTGAELNTLTGGGDVGALHTHAAAYQPLDAELTSLAALSYVAASFVKMTGANTFALRTIGETADDLEGTIVHDNLANVHQGVATGDAPLWSGIYLTNVDTLLARVSAGVVSIAGTNIAMVGGAHHDGFSDSVANEHIDHTGVTLTAGTGLTGGGDISAGRSFDLDINSLAAAAITAGDFVPFWDITATATNKKITFTNFEAALTHDNLIAGTIADHDTDATGAELDTLTDNSMADVLHRHSELSASDGTPDQSLFVDASGNVGIKTTNPQNVVHIGAGADAPFQPYAGLFICDTANSQISIRDSGNDIEGGFFAHSGGYIYMGAWTNDGLILRTNNANRITIGTDGGIVIANMKAGTTQANAGAAVNELWRDTDDGNTVKLGV